MAPEPTLAEQHAFLDSAKAYEFVDVRNSVAENPALVNVQPGGRWSALHQAAQAGCADTVRFLLEHGANSDARTNAGQRPVDVAKPGECVALLAPKRKAESDELPGEPVAKAPALPVAAAAAPSPVQLQARLISGDLLATVAADGSWKAADVRKALAPHLAADTAISALLYGESQELSEAQTLKDQGVVDDTEIKVTVRALAKLHLFKPCSAEEFAGRHNDWDCDEGPFVVDGVQHRGMDDAPADGRAIAQAFKEACPDLEEIIVFCSESDCHGEVIVIADPGDKPLLACCEALAIRKEVWQYASITEENFSQKLECGFNKDGEDDDEDDEDHRKPGLLRITKIMSERLVNHFTLHFEETVVSAPVVFGGYASDGSIVGVISGRVWT